MTTRRATIALVIALVLAAAGWALCAARTLASAEYARASRVAAGAAARIADLSRRTGRAPLDPAVDREALAAARTPDTLAIVRDGVARTADGRAVRASIDRARLLTEDRALVLGSGARRVVTAPVKDADDWNIVGAVAVVVRPFAALTSVMLVAVATALLALVLALVGVRQLARRPARGARGVLVAAMGVLAAGTTVLVMLQGAGLAHAAAGLDLAHESRLLGASTLAFPSLGWSALLEWIVTLLAAAAVLGIAWLASARRRPAEVRETVAAWGFLAPSLAHLLVFSVGPLLFAFIISFHRWDLLQRAKPFIGLGNYREMAHDPLFWTSMRNTALYALNVPVTMALALGAALILDQPLRGIRIIRTVVFLPYVVSYVAIAIVWQWIFNADYGLLDYLLRLAHLPPVDWLGNPATALIALMIVSAWVQLGYQMVIFLAGLQGIPQSLYEAARLDGAGAWQRFRHITLPLLRPVSVYVFITGVIWSFQVFTLVYVMTEGGPVHATDVIVYRIYQSAWEFRRMGYASAMSWALFAVLFVLTLLQWRLLSRKVDYA